MLPKKVSLYPAPPRLPVEVVQPRAHDGDCRSCPLRRSARVVLRGERALGSDPEDPRTLLVVGGGPGRDEDAEGRPFVGRVGARLRPLLRKLWKGSIVLDSSTRCHAGRGREKMEVDESHIEACRPFLAASIADAKPSRIIALGSEAIFSLTGRRISPLNSRRGYAWLWNEGNPVPVFYVLDPAEGLRNRFLMRFFEEDLAWAATARVPEPKHLGSDFHASVVVTSEDAARAAEDLSRGEGFAFDLEWAGHLWNKDFRLLALAAAAVGRGTAWVWDEEALADPERWEPLARLLRDPDVPKGGSNVKADLHALWCGKKLRPLGVSFDTRLERKLLEPDATANLEDMAELVGMGGHKEEAEAALAIIEKRIKDMAAGEKRKRSARQGGFDFAEAVDAAVRLGFSVEQYAEEPRAVAYAFLDPDLRRRYVCRDALTTARLQSRFSHGLLRHPNQRRIWEKIVLPAAGAIQRVEEWGVPYDAQAGSLFRQLMAQEMAAAYEKVQQYRIDPAKELNPGSPQQLGRVLYDKLGLSPPSFTEANQPSTDESALLHLRAVSGHPLPGHILEYRHYQKLVGYADDWARCVREDGRIHPSIHLDGARCLPAGELVLTARGYIPVQHVKCGDLVLTHEGRARRVTETFTNPERPIVRVRLANGLTLRTTEDHEYMTDSGWQLAKDLRVGTLVRVHSEAEQWRPIEGWPYLVSSWGRVKAIKPRTQGQGVLALQQKYKGTPQGHLKVSLVRGDRARKSRNRADFGVHQLVLKAFGGPCPKGASEVRHLNGIAWDNTVTNLAWGTPAQNRADAVRHGGDFAKNTRILSASDVAFIRAQPRKPHGGAGRWLKSGVSDSSLAARFGVSREQIRDIRSGKKWLDPRAPVERAEGRRAVFSFAPVLSVELEPSARNFGLNVEEDHSHVTAGIVTHNSGRSSCSSPNLQNIPRAADSEDGKRARDCFVAPSGKVLVQLDYSQLELRIAALISGDTAMADLFRSGVDFHLGTAKLISKLAWGIEPEQVTKVHRTGAKAFNFGIAYGKTDRSLAAELGIDASRAAQIRKAIFGAFVDYGEWCKEAISHARQHGGCWTIWEGERARWRSLWRIADDTEEGAFAASKAKNGALNTPIQGTASDFCVASIARLVDMVDRRELDAEVVLPIHDSIMLVCPEKTWKDSALAARDAMTSYPWCTEHVPLEVDVEVGAKWGSLEKVEV